MIRPSLGSGLAQRGGSPSVYRRPAACTRALLVLLALAACGGPQEPQSRTKPGALAELFAKTKRQPPKPQEAAKAAPEAYVIIRFDRPGIVFEDALYTAMNRALERYPAAQFDVVLAMPPLGPHADPEEWMRLGEQHIENVVLAMTDMGLPAGRLRIAASTDERATADEIRIYVR